MKVLDLFCGMGGFSIGFHREGFECYGLDNVDVGYPYELIKQDIRDYQPNGERFDVVVASPPCNEFSRLRLAPTPRKPFIDGSTMVHLGQIPTLSHVHFLKNGEGCSSCL